MPPIGPIDPGQHLWGFGGLHGGLALGLMTSAMGRDVSGYRLHGVTAQFHRSLRGAFEIDIELVRAGKAVTTVASRAVSEAGAHVTASAVLGPSRPEAFAPVAPASPAAPPPDECDVFAVPPELVPIAEQTEIRPVGPARPYAGGAEPELIAWVRLVEDDEPPDEHRFVFLMDALAPSYAAVLPAPVLIPTIELSVRPADGLSGAASPWVLLRARADAVSAGGWVDERVDAWGVDGTYLGSAQQLRLVRLD